MVFIPVVETWRLPVGTALSEEEFEPRYLIPPPQSVIRKELESVGLDNIDIPEKWIRLGSSVTIRLPELPGETKRIIGEIYSRVIGVRSVYEISGRIRGEFREPEVNLIHGPGGRIIHLENGLRYAMDPARVMFSPGNVHVRTSVRNMDLRGKRVIDMFSGIGYFSLGIAKYSSPDEVHSCEINPTSFRFLKENIEINKLRHVITPYLGDSRLVAPNIKADVVIMGNFKSFEYLPHALIRIVEGGTLVMHDVIPTDGIDEYKYRLYRRLRQYGWKGTIKERKTVKSYGPHMWHIVLRVAVTKV